jgi:hypothetical protein
MNRRLEVTEFVTISPGRRYRHVLTGVIWLARGVNAFVEPVSDENGVLMKPSAWLDRHRPSKLDTAPRRRRRQ